MVQNTLSPIHRRLTGLVVALGLVGGGVLVAPLPAQAAASVSIPNAVAQILSDTNALRIAGGLTPLVESTALDSVAQSWSAQMYANGALTHNPNYSTQIPAGWTAAGENIASGYSYTTVVEAWHQSPGHYANIMGNYNAIGIGYVESNGTSYFTQDFGNYSTVPSPGTTTATAPAPSGADASFVQAAYADVLGRSPSGSEVQGWTALLSRGVPRDAIASGFNNSDEYRLHMIDAAYTDVLKRTPDAGGRISWLNGMRSGTLQPDDAHRIFLSTDEFYQNVGGGTDAGYLAALYSDVIGRAPNSSEVAYWIPILSRIGRQGTVNAFWFAAETINRQAGDLFTVFLGRSASSADVSSWSSIIRGNGLTSARNMIMSSGEYGARAVVRFP
jgi:hypothetical protein